VTEHEVVGKRQGERKESVSDVEFGLALENGDKEDPFWCVQLVGTGDPMESNIYS
jgi:hypothetical protein